MRLIAIVCLMAACTFPQKAESHLPVTDAEKIADALRAGPAFITYIDRVGLKLLFEEGERVLNEPMRAPEFYADAIDEIGIHFRPGSHITRRTSLFPLGRLTTPTS